MCVCGCGGGGGGGHARARAGPSCARALCPPPPSFSPLPHLPIVPKEYKRALWVDGRILAKARQLLGSQRLCAWWGVRARARVCVRVCVRVGGRGASSPRARPCPKDRHQQQAAAAAIHAPLMHPQHAPTQERTRARTPGRARGWLSGGAPLPALERVPAAGPSIAAARWGLHRGVGVGWVGRTGGGREGVGAKGVARAPCPPSLPLPLRSPELSDPSSMVGEVSRSRPTNGAKYFL